MKREIVKKKNIKNMVAYLLLNSSFITDLGLFHGKMGIVLFFAHYGRFTGNSLYNEFAGELLDEIYEDIPINPVIDFENGLCGIGWGIEYLVRNGFMEGNTDAILEEVDRKIMERDPRRITDLSFRSGLGGILYYVLARLTSSRKTRIKLFDELYISELCKVTQEAVFKEENEIPFRLVTDFFQSIDGKHSISYQLTLSDILSPKEFDSSISFDILPLGIENGLTNICFFEIMQTR